MVLEVVKATELEIDKVERKDALTQLVVFIKIYSLVAATSKKRVEEEDWKSSGHENWVLYDVNDQIDIKAGSSSRRGHVLKCPGLK